VALILLVRVTVHAARSIGSERDRQTLDSLLTTLLTPGEIVRDKWWGSLLAARWVFVWLVIHWLFGILVMALHPLAAALLAVEVLVFAAFAASLGLYFATRASTTRQATTAALIAFLFGTTILPWAAGQAVMAALPGWSYTPSRMARVPAYRYYRTELVWPEKLALGLSPVRVLYNSTVSGFDVYNPYIDAYGTDRALGGVFPSAAFGLTAYAGLAWLFARRAAVRFRRSYGAPQRPAVAPRAGPAVGYALASPSGP
jgi:hypothetical protein